MTTRTVLVTGGLGYIGSHTVVELINYNYNVVIIDNLSNSKIAVLQRIEKITGTTPKLFIGDVRDREFLHQILTVEKIDSVIHFAGLKSVSESQMAPLKYYDNNVIGSITLLNELLHFNINTILFSSSATVYGTLSGVKYSEDSPLDPINVYGRTKLMIEDVLRSMYVANPELRIGLLRYFNPVGAHQSGLIGEDPSGIPNNLMPFITQVAIRKLEKVIIYGNDYLTPDGTGLRDYIHVVDLAKGHLAALEKLRSNPQVLTLNLGTGRPYSVLEVIAAFENAAKLSIPYEIAGRRAGDLPEYYADPSLAKKLLGWHATMGIEKICTDSWNWQKNNPAGYED